MWGRVQRLRTSYIGINIHGGSMRGHVFVFCVIVAAVSLIDARILTQCPNGGRWHPCYFNPCQLDTGKCPADLSLRCEPDYCRPGCQVRFFNGDDEVTCPSSIRSILFDILGL